MKNKSTYPPSSSDMDENGGHYTKWIKSDEKGQYCMVSLICEIKQKVGFIETVEKWLSGVWKWEKYEVGKKVHSFSYKINNV